MTKHVSKSEMERFTAGALPQAELNSISDHLTTCEACHQLFVEALRAEKGSAPLSFMTEPEDLLRHEHIEYEHLVGLADDNLDATDKEIIDTHVSACKTCRERITSFLAFKDQLEPELRVSYGPAAREPQRKKAVWATWWERFAWNPAYAAAIVLVVIGLVVALVVLRRRSATLEAKRTTPSPINVVPPPTPSLDNQAARNTSPTPVLTSSPQLPSLQPTPVLTVKNRQPIKIENAGAVAVLSDEGRAVRVDKAGNVSGLEQVSQDTRRQVVEAVTTQTIKTPETVTELAGVPMTLRGPDEGPKFKLRSPARTVILSDRPLFQWDALPGASGYQVSVGDLNGHLVARSDQLTSDRTAWTPPSSLKRGEIYAWDVVAIVDGKKVFAPGTSETQMKFKVLSDKSARELEQLEEANSHLALGVFYAREGMLAEAERELQILVRDNPKSAVLRKLLNQIQSWSQK